MKDSNCPHKKTSFYLPVFSVNEKRNHGGIRRSTQIFDDLQPMFTLEPIQLRSLSFFKLILFFCYGAFDSTSLISLRSVRLFLKSAIIVGRFKYFLKINRLNSKNCHFYFELSDNSLFLVWYLARKTFNYTVFPQNIEFLVNGKNPKDFIFRANLEVEIYKKATQCVAISKVDAFLLSIFNKNVILYPYFPSSVDVLRFEKIRMVRKIGNIDESLFIIMGTVSNSPTKLGIEYLLSFLQDKKTEKNRFELIGFGTENYINLACGNISILGSVPDEVLDVKLALTSAVIIFQPPTTGFLTRIVELNLAGVPVFINKSYIPAQGLEKFGILSYENLSDILVYAKYKKNSYHTFCKPSVQWKQ